jgi:hypothetical protein
MRCCGQFNPTTGYSQVSCRATCAGGTGTDTFVELCDPKVTPTTCPSGMTCQVSGSLTGYSICK